MILTGGLGDWAGIGLTAAGTLGGGLVGGSISYANGGNFWSGADRGAMIGSFVGPLARAAFQLGVAGWELGRIAGGAFGRGFVEGSAGGLNVLAADFFGSRAAFQQAKGLYGGFSALAPDELRMYQLIELEAKASAAESVGAIQANEVTTYEDFAERSVIGDNLEGHELWQHTNLKANGLATERQVLLAYRSLQFFTRNSDFAR